MLKSAVSPPVFLIGSVPPAVVASAELAPTVVASCEVPPHSGFASRRSCSQEPIMAFTQVVQVIVPVFSAVENLMALFQVPQILTPTAVAAPAPSPEVLLKQVENTKEKLTELNTKYNFCLQQWDGEES